MDLGIYGLKQKHCIVLTQTPLKVSGNLKRNAYGGLIDADNAQWCYMFSFDVVFIDKLVRNSVLNLNFSLYFEKRGFAFDFESEFQI